MSLKNSKPEKKKPRAMPMETIVTRFKSAQQKQLLENNQTKNITKSKNMKSKKLHPNLNITKRKLTQHRKVHVNKNQEKLSKDKIDNTKVENKEYYPNKLKRKVLNAKIFLAPKHCFKVICGTKSSNKRKLHVPKRDVKYIKEEINCPSNPDSDTKSPKHNTQPGLSIIDMVRIIEENGSLDDEDLLEILTCPSPVWWEEPPDGYSEEALFSQPQPLERISIKKQLQNEQKKEEQRRNHEEKEESNNKIAENELNLRDTIEIDIISKDKSFINKRFKLEALLGNIRNKVSKPIIDKSNTSNNETNIKSAVKEVNRKKKSNSECTEEDLSEFRDDEILKHLENLEIPMEVSCKASDVKSEDENDILKSRRNSTDSNESDKDITEEYLDLSLLDDDEKQDIDELNDSIKCESMNLSSDLKSTYNSSHDELNLEINDNIIKDIDTKNNIQNDIDEINDKNNEMIENISSVLVNSEFNESRNNQKNEFVTVYKILNSSTSVEESHNVNKQFSDIEQIDKRKDIKDKIDGKINSYYKQCKKICNSNCKSLELKNENLDSKNQQKLNYNDNKSITISEMDKIKYCFICSSIFDTDSCNYCLRKNLKRKLNEYSCDVCGLNVNSKQEIIKHLTDHYCK